jgi:hypothetical protein
MSPLDAVAYGLSRQRELLPSNRIDKLVNSVSVSDGSAERSLTSQCAATAADIVANVVTALVRAGKRIGASLSAPRLRVP